MLRLFRCGTMFNLRIWLDIVGVCSRLPFCFEVELSACSQVAASGGPDLKCISPVCRKVAVFNLAMAIRLHLPRWQVADDEDVAVAVDVARGLASLKCALAN